MSRTRREFLDISLATSAVVSLSAVAPQFLLQAVEETSQAEENILVVVQLSGGNDGLNTVVPYGDDAYYRNRKKLAIAKKDVLKIDDYAGFHPNLTGFDELLQQKKLAIVQGVGYPNPNRSHFESMDIWHTARRKNQDRNTGWIGRYLDETATKKKQDIPALHLGGGKQPLALAAMNVRTPSINSIDNFQLRAGKEKNAAQMIDRMARQQRDSKDSLLGFVQTSTTSALTASKKVQQATKGYKTDVKYPDYNLAEKLQKVAMLIDAGLASRIYYVTLEGFDTHSSQAAGHNGLLKELSSSVSAFIQDVSSHGHGKRVLLCCFSEFGRRVKENASAGTDHGTAAPMFLMGDKVKAGLFGKQPSLTDLQGGDLKHHTDFRQVYATLLQNWLQSPSANILDKKYKPLDLLNT